MTDTNEIKTTARKRTRLVKFLRRSAVVLIAVIVLASLSRAIVTAMKTRQQVSTIAAETRVLQQQQVETQAQLNSTQETLRLSKKNLHALSAHIATAQLEHRYQSNDWLLLKVRYYLELSCINAQWSDNAATTVALLQAADAQLATVHDPRVFPVRQAIAKEIAEWQALSPVDITGLFTQLDAAQHIIDRLKVKKMPSRSLPPSSELAQKSSKTWRDRLEVTLHQLEQLVVIQHHEEAIQPLFTPAYESMLRENIRLNLQETQWAIIQHNPAVYQLSLTQAIDTLRRGFDLTNPITQSLLQQLTTMQKTQLHQAKPALGRSLLLLNQWIESMAQSSVAEEHP
ncbi:MAG TPA: hypothetical protein DDY37_00180 [Legionella sp.]|nr:hypothetical protein [Legionella sp.]